MIWAHLNCTANNFQAILSVVCFHWTTSKFYTILRIVYTIIPAHVDNACTSNGSRPENQPTNYGSKSANQGSQVRSLKPGRKQCPWRTQRRVLTLLPSASGTQWSCTEVLLLQLRTAACTEQGEGHSLDGLAFPAAGKSSEAGICHTIHVRTSLIFSFQTVTFSPLFEALLSGPVTSFPGICRQVFGKGVGEGDVTDIL